MIERETLPPSPEAIFEARFGKSPQAIEPGELIRKIRWSFDTVKWLQYIKHEEQIASDDERGWFYFSVGVAGEEEWRERHRESQAALVRTLDAAQPFVGESLEFLGRIAMSRNTHASSETMLNEWVSNPYPLWGMAGITKEQKAILRGKITIKR